MSRSSSGKTVSDPGRVIFLNNGGSGGGGNNVN
jgi:hypothetical protein